MSQEMRVNSCPLVVLSVREVSAGNTDRRLILEHALLDLARRHAEEMLEM